MPKKFGVNDKAAAARERKDTVKKEENARKQKEKEDKLWEETDPKVIAIGGNNNEQILKQQARKQEEEKKKQEQVKRQAEKKALEEKERQELAKKYAKPTDTKVTRAMIEEQRRLEREQQERERKKQEKEEQEIPIEENINHIIRNQQIQHEEEGLNVVEARSVEEAVEKLSLDGDVDRHPEKRMKAAYLAYEANNLPILKQENPGLKLSQLKELLWKQWQKAPENPLNQQ